MTNSPNGRNTPTTMNTADTQPPLHEQIEREDDVIYADDANLIIEHDTPPQLDAKLLNYREITATRQVGIRWRKVHILERQKTRIAIRPALFRPFGSIPIQTIVAILAGGGVNISPNGIHEVYGG